jgi:hypothetical protein
LVLIVTSGDKQIFKNRTTHLFKNIENKKIFTTTILIKQQRFMSTEKAMQPDITIRDTTTVKYVCKECGSSEVQYCLRVWYDANTDEINDEGEEWEDTYCDNCEDNCSIVEYDDYDQINHEIIDEDD